MLNRQAPLGLRGWTNSEATPIHFLQRVPHIRFRYAPADFAVQYLYRAGSEWHRLHTIIKGNQVNRINEVCSLVKLLDPGEVVRTLHDDGELTALKQPLHGRARDKLTRHLHDTLALSREWISLATAADKRRSRWRPHSVN